MAEHFANEPTTTLTAGINAAVTSLVVSSSTGFPTVNFRVRIDNEILLVTTVAGTTWTVTRGAESTTAASHATLAPVAHILTAGGLAQAFAEVGKALTTLVAGSGSNLTTTSSTLVDLDSSMNTSYVSSGGVLVVIVIATLTNDTVGSYSTLGVSINGTDTLGTGTQASGGNYRGSTSAIGRTSGLAAGTYTIKPRFRTSTATTTTALTVGGERWMLIMEF